MFAVTFVEMVGTFVAVTSVLLAAVGFGVARIDRKQDRDAANLVRVHERIDAHMAREEEEFGEFRDDLSGVREDVSYIAGALKVQLPRHQ